MLYYNCSKGQEIVKGRERITQGKPSRGVRSNRMGSLPKPQKNKKICEKPLDNLKDLWYNKNVKRVVTYHEKGCVIMEKMTYVTVLDKVLKGETLSAEELSKVSALKESIAKRNAQKPNGPTKTQRENAETAEAVASAMVEGVTYSIPDICALLPALNGATSQKVGPLMQKLVDAGRVVKSVVKGHNFYTLA